MFLVYFALLLFQRIQNLILNATDSKSNCNENVIKTLSSCKRKELFIFFFLLFFPQQLLCKFQVFFELRDRAYTDRLVRSDKI